MVLWGKDEYLSTCLPTRASCRHGAEQLTQQVVVSVPQLALLCSVLAKLDVHGSVWSTLIAPSRGTTVYWKGGSTVEHREKLPREPVNQRVQVGCNPPPDTRTYSSTYT